MSVVWESIGLHREERLASGGEFGSLDESIRSKDPDDMRLPRGYVTMLMCME